MQVAQVSVHIHIYIPAPPHTTTIIDHHHTVQVAQVQVHHLTPVAGWKSTTSASCKGWYHNVCKWTIYASGWIEKCHQRKLQLVTTTTKEQRSRHKVQRSGLVSAQLHQTTATTITIHMWPTHHNAAISATCGGPTIHPTSPALMQAALIVASCCVGHTWSGVEFVVACSCADVGPDLCTICPYLCTVHSDLTLRLWFPYFQLVQTLHLCRWWLSPVATCAGGAISFSR